MPTTTTTYSFNKPVVGADEDDWGGYLNGNWDSVDDLLDGTTPITGIDINSGTLDGVTIGGTTAGAGTFTTLTANTSITGTLATAAQPNVTSLGTLTGLTVSASASLAGATTTADITFGDNDKAIFGAGSDLQIYHDGNHSYIKDVGTGHLKVFAEHFFVNNSDDTEQMIGATVDGAVDLFFNGSKKLATTSTGVDISGTLTSDGLTVDGDANLSGTAVNFDLDETDTTDLNTRFRQSAGQLFVQTANDAKSVGYNRLNINHSTGDISFYEDTGTTAKFFWDASAERLGIGTTSPTTALTVSTDGTEQLTINRADASINSGNTVGTILFTGDDPSANQTGARIQVIASQNWSTNAYGSHITFSNDNSGTITERMRIDSSGNLQLTSVDQDIEFNANSSSNESRLKWNYGGTLQSWIEREHSDGSMVFGNQGSERMRIDSSGNVGIGTSSPAYKLQLSNSADTDLNIIAGKNSGDFAAIIFGDTDYPAEGRITYQNFDDAMRFWANRNQAMIIDSSGNVGIGASSPSVSLHVDASGGGAIRASRSSVGGEYVQMDHDGSNGTIRVSGANSLILNTNSAERMRIDSSGNVGIGVSPSTKLHVKAGTNQNFNVFGPAVFSNGVTIASTTDGFTGYLEMEQRATQFAWHNGTTERMRIDSSGNLLVGKTSTAFGTAGNRLLPDGGIYGTKDGAAPFAANRLTSDGDIMSFWKDTVQVGSIGVDNTDNLTISGNSSHCGLNFSTDDVNPYKNGAYTNGTTSLGTPSTRFKDLYLSGGVYLGGTGSANKLDDYEEGTFTPTFVGSTGGTVTLGSAFDTYAYTKIGRIVTITGRVDVSGTPSLSGNLLLQGLPFTSGNLTDQAGYTVQYGFITIGASNTGNPIVIELQEGTTEAALRLEDWTTASGVLVNNSRIQMSITYFTS